MVYETIIFCGGIVFVVILFISLVPPPFSEINALKDFY